MAENESKAPLERGDISSKSHYVGCSGLFGGASQRREDYDCAICLQAISPIETAIIKGCEHTFCATCILTWAALKQPTPCPECNKNFSYLYTYRTLDGEATDEAVLESLLLLLQTSWFDPSTRFGLLFERGGPIVPATPFEGDAVVEADEKAYFEEDDEYEEDIYGHMARLARRSVSGGGQAIKRGGGGRRGSKAGAKPDRTSSSTPVGRRAQRAARRRSTNASNASSPGSGAGSTLATTAPASASSASPARTANGLARTRSEAGPTCPMCPSAPVDGLQRAFSEGYRQGAKTGNKMSAKDKRLAKAAVKQEKEAKKALARRQQREDRARAEAALREAARVAKLAKQKQAEAEALANQALAAVAASTVLGNSCSASSSQASLATDTTSAEAVKAGA